jgi:hypothetical protein
MRITTQRNESAIPRYERRCSQKKEFGLKFSLEPFKMNPTNSLGGATLKIEQAKRVKQIPPYVFAEIDRKKTELREKGMDLIDLGIGDPDIPTPKRIIDRLMDLDAI